MPKGISLHIGLNSVDPNHYDGWSGPLNACEADAEDMEEIAKSRNMSAHRLLTTRATRGAVVSALTEFAQALDENDFLFLTYSGHGGQLPDVSGDEPEGRDETWCLYDGELIDDEVNVLLARLRPGVRAFVLSDSCHSGTVVRDAFYGSLRATGALAALTGDESGSVPAIRAMPAPLALRVYRKHRAFYDDLQSQIPKDVEQAVKAAVVLFSGCQDNQTSSDGTFNGLFTANLLRIWKKGTFSGDYRAFHRTIGKLMPPVQTPNYFRIGGANPRFDAQSPFTV